VLKEFYRSIYFFNAWVMQNTSVIYVELQKVYRQADEQFLNLLNNFRSNSITPNDYKLLAGRVDEMVSEKSTKGIITLTTHNRKADHINDKELAKIKTDEFVFLPEIIGEFPEKIYPLDKELVLKKGA